MLFAVRPRSSILRYLPEQGAVEEFCRDLPGVSGLAFDRSGNLYACQSASRRLLRFHGDGRISPMEHLLDGHFHNHPFDLAIDGLGRIWFSDPWESGPRRGAELQGPLEHCSVLRLERDAGRAWAIQRATYDTQGPRALALSLDERVLYVSENPHDADAARDVRAYPIQPDGALGNYEVLHAFGADAFGAHRGADGMCLDEEGNIVACAGWSRGGPGPMVYVISPTGRVLETHPTPVDWPVACAFGDLDLASLYVTSSAGHVFRVRSPGRRGGQRL
jgi:gluconolactonase